MPDTIRVQAADGRWETLGVDRYRGVRPEAILPTWNGWGPDSLAFALKRDPTVNHPDIQPFTPLEYAPDGGRVTWAGYTIDAPGSGASDPQVAVQAQGCQYHTDDDPFAELFSVRDLSAWRDARSFPEARLGPLAAAPTLEAGDGAIRFGWPKGAAMTDATHVGVILDLGPGSRARYLAFDYDSENMAGNGAFRLYSRGMDTADPLPPEPSIRWDEIASLAFATAPAAGNQQGGIATPRRYVAILLANTFNGTAQLDHIVRLTAIRVYGDPAYQSAGQSALKSSHVLAVALARAPLLDPSTDDIAVPGFVMPAFGDPQTEATGREYMERANSYLGWRLKVDHRRRLIHQPQPSRPALRVNVGDPGVEFVDTSVNSGRDVYNKITVRGRSGAGDPLEAVRYSGHATDTAIDTSAIAQPSNPSATVDTSGWAGTTGGFVRVTDPVKVFSAPASFELAALNDDDAAATTTVTNTSLRDGDLIFFDFRAARRQPGPPHHFLAVELTLTPSGRRFRIDVDVGDTYRRYAVAFRQRGADTGYTIRAYGKGNRDDLLGVFDDFRIGRLTLTGPDRRGLFRSKVLDVQAPTTREAMEAIGDAYLLQTARAPLRGTLTVTGRAVKQSPGGASIHPGDLGMYTGEIITLADVVEPTTGEKGRNGILAGVSYQDGVATITLDNARGNFEALLARMAVVGS